MAEIRIRSVDSVQMPREQDLSFTRFLQQMLNRRTVGILRYGAETSRRKRYMTRLKVELEAYQKTGNLEQLINIAVYAWLESFAPENKNFHHNPLAESATRGRKEFK